MANCEDHAKILFNQNLGGLASLAFGVAGAVIARQRHNELLDSIEDAVSAFANILDERLDRQRVLDARSKLAEAIEKWSLSERANDINIKKEQLMDAAAKCAGAEADALAPHGKYHGLIAYMEAVTLRSRIYRELISLGVDVADLRSNAATEATNTIISRQTDWIARVKQNVRVMGPLPIIEGWMLQVNDETIELASDRNSIYALEGSYEHMLIGPIRMAADVLVDYLARAEQHPADAFTRKPLYRLKNDSPGRMHFFTMRDSEASAVIVARHMHYEGVVCYVNDSPGDGAIMMRRLLRGGHYYSVSEQEWAAWERLGYALEGAVGYVYDSAGDGRVPLHRVLWDDLGCFMTTNLEEARRAGGNVNENWCYAYGAP